MVLDEDNIEIWQVYLLTRNQIRVAPMGEVIGLDYAAVLNVVKLYVNVDEIKKTFEGVLECFRIEQESEK